MSINHLFHKVLYKRKNTRLHGLKPCVHSVKLAIVMKDKKLIVFDWNGTILADTLPCWRASNMCLEFFGAAPISLKQYQDTAEFPVIHFYTRNGVCVDSVLKKQKEANALFYENYQARIKNVRTRQGTRALLGWLNDAGYDCTILSNYMTDEIKIMLKKMKLEQYFVHVCGNEDGNTVLRHATKKERLSNFMLKRGYRAQNTWIIGDSTEEPQIAHHLGLKSVSITGGYFSKKRLRAAEPNFIVGNLKDVIEILQNEC